MKKFIYHNCILLSALWALIILALCSTPGQFIPSVSWLEMLSFDKWVHAGVFFILCSCLFIVAVKKSQSLSALIIYFIICVFYGGLLEIMQAKCFSNRCADWQDFVANSFGCLISALLYKKIKSAFIIFS